MTEAIEGPKKKVLLEISEATHRDLTDIAAANGLSVRALSRIFLNIGIAKFKTGTTIAQLIAEALEGAPE